jgi:hypothetical protein
VDHTPKPPTEGEASRWAKGLQTTRLALRQPGPERDSALLIVKTSLAMVAAWQFAVHVMHSRTPFFAPATALLVVDRTMIRSVWAGVQRIAAVVLGISTAWVVGVFVGVSWWTMIPVLCLALLLGTWSRLGAHGRDVPSMVLLSLLTVGGTSGEFTYWTLVETVAGGVIGVLTNAVVIAPLHLHRPREQVASFASQVRDLLADMAHGLTGEWDERTARDWYRTGDRIGELAPQVVEEIQTGRESTKLNPRDNLRPLQLDWEGYATTVEVLRQALWQVTGIARTLVDAADERYRQPAPSPRFLERYAQALSAMSEAVSQFGLRTPEAAEAFDKRAAQAEAILAGLRETVRTTPLEDHEAWPVYGSLISDALRAVTDLRRGRSKAVLPTDSGPLPVIPPVSPSRRLLRTRSRARRFFRRES